MIYRIICQAAKLAFVIYIMDVCNKWDKGNDSEKVVENSGMGELPERSTSQLCLRLAKGYTLVYGGRAPVIYPIPINSTP